MFVSLHLPVAGYRLPRGREVTFGRFLWQRELSKETLGCEPLGAYAPASWGKKERVGWVTPQYLLDHY